MFFKRYAVEIPAEHPARVMNRSTVRTGKFSLLWLASAAQGKTLVVDGYLCQRGDLLVWCNVVDGGHLEVALTDEVEEAAAVA